MKNLYTLTFTLLSFCIFGQSSYNIDDVHNQQIDLNGEAITLYDNGGANNDYDIVEFADSVSFIAENLSFDSQIKVTFNPINSNGDLIDVDGTSLCNFHGVKIYDGYNNLIGTYCNSVHPEPELTLFGGSISIVAYCDGEGSGFEGFDITIEEVMFEQNYTGPYTYGGTEDDEAFSIIKTQDGNYFISGRTKSNDEDVPNNGESSNNTWSLKVDLDGNKLWVTDKFDGFHYNSHIEEIQSGYLVSEGKFLLKYNKDNGDLINSYEVISTGSVFGESFEKTDDGGVLVAISREYDDDFEVYFTKLSSQLEPEIIIERPSPNIEWGQRIISILRDVNGDYVCVGEKQQVNSGCNGGCFTSLVDNNQENAGCPDHDIWILRLSSNFSVKSSYVFGGDSDERLYSGGIDQGGNVYLTGRSLFSDNSGPCSSVGPDGLGDSDANVNHWITKLNRSNNILETNYLFQSDGYYPGYSVKVGNGDQLMVTSYGNVDIYSSQDLSFVKNVEESFILEVADVIVDSNQEDCFAFAGKDVFFIKPSSSEVINFNNYYSFVRSICDESTVVRCDQAISIGCGETYVGSTIGMSNDFASGDYSCTTSTASFDGPDQVFVVEKTLSSGYLNVTMFHPNSSSNNLSVFIFNECGDQMSCQVKGNNIGSGQNILGEWIQDNPDPQPAGTYYIVVDGSDATVTSEFSLTVTCSQIQEISGTSINCGQKLEGETNAFGTNNQSIYYGDAPYTNANYGNIAPERVYEFSLTEAQTVTITLDDFETDEDFELYLAYADCPASILSPEFCTIASSTNPAGNMELIEEDLTDGDYLIIVDGYRKNVSLEPTIGTYDLEVFGCDSPIEVIFDIGAECGAVGSEVEIPITVENFNEISSFMFDIELPASANYEIVGVANFHPLFTDIDLYSSFPTSNSGTIIWFDNTFTPRTLTNGTKIFDLVVKVNNYFNDDVIVNGDNAVIDSPINNVEARVKEGALCAINSVEVEGLVYNEDGVPAKNVQVALIGQASFSTFTDDDGYYKFEELETGEYEIKCEYDGPLGEGVDVVDLVKVRGHFLNLLTLDSDYKLIAADVRRDEAINVIDVSNVLGISLNKLNSLQGNTSWRFIPAALDISNNPLAEDLPTSITINVNSSIIGQDFIAVKIGDVTNDAMTELQKDETSTRSGSDWSIKIGDVEGFQEDSISVGFMQDGITDITSLGLDILYDTLFLLPISLESDLPGFSEANYTIEDGLIKVVWADALLNPFDLTVNDALTVNFAVDDRAEGTTTVSATNVKATNGALDEVDVDVQSGTITVEMVSGTHVLASSAIKIYPNPSKEDVVVECNGDFKYRIYNVSGQLLRSGKGKNEIVLSDDSFLGSGVYFMRIYNGEGDRMVKVRRI